MNFTTHNISSNKDIRFLLVLLKNKLSIQWQLLKNSKEEFIQDHHGRYTSLQWVLKWSKLRLKPKYNKEKWEFIVGKQWVVSGQKIEEKKHQR